MNQIIVAIVQCSLISHIILASNVLKIVLISRAFFCKYLRNNMQYTVSKTFGWDTFENKATYSGVY